MTTQLEDDKFDILLNDYLESGEIVKQIEGHYTLLGKSANIEKNRMYVIDDDAVQYILMFCEKNTFTKISVDLFDKLKEFNHTWYLLQNGYIGTHFIINESDTILYLHQFITNYYGNGKGHLSVDHINRNKLDNRSENLRIINQSEQNKNCDKRNRKYNAIDLPDELQNCTIPKYVYYCSEIMNKGKPTEYVRDFFRIEKHPNLIKKCWSSTKSIKMSIIDKLILTKKHLKELDNITDNNQPVIPEPVNTESVKTEVVKKESVKTEVVKTEPVKTESAKKEPVKKESVKKESVKTEVVNHSRNSTAFDATKRKRNYNARKLPSGINESDIPKYVNYCSEIMNKGKPSECTRDFFRIENHPNLNKKSWSSTKSKKFSIIEKLNLTIKYLDELH